MSMAKPLKPLVLNHVLMTFWTSVGLLASQSNPNDVAPTKMVGAVVSVTLMFCVNEVVLSHASVADQTRRTV